MTYTVNGADGVMIKTYKTLAAAKKLAEKTEGAVVVCDGRQVYPEGTDLTGVGGEVSPEAVNEKDGFIGIDEDPSPDQVKTARQDTQAKPYKVVIRVNIRRKPSLDADKVGAADAGTILEACEDLGDWLKIRHRGGIAYARHKNYEYIRPLCKDGRQV